MGHALRCLEGYQIQRIDLCSHTKVGADKKQETVTVVLNENDVLWPDYRHMFIADCMDQVAIRLAPTLGSALPRLHLDRAVVSDWLLPLLKLLPKLLRKLLLKVLLLPACPPARLPAASARLAG